MARQINQYTKTRTQATIQNDDLLDFDSTENSGTTYESAKITVQQFLAYVNANNPTIYSANGTLPSARTITSATYETKFVAGDISCQMNNETDDYAFLIREREGGERARLGYDNSENTAILQLRNTAGLFLESSDNKLHVNTTSGGVSFGDLTAFTQLGNAKLSVHGEFRTTANASFGNATVIANTINSPEDYSYMAGKSGFRDQTTNDRCVLQPRNNVFAVMNELMTNVNLQVDSDSTDGNTRLMIWDVDNGQLERVSVGAADSGGTGFKTLRIAN